MNTDVGMSAKTIKEIHNIYEELSTPLNKSHDLSPEEEDPQDIDLIHTKNGPHDVSSKEVWLDSKGSLLYYQPYKGNEHSLRPFEEHAYIVILDDTKIQGHSVSTTNIRNVLGSKKYNDNQKKKFFRWVFGWFDVGLYQLMVYKFRNAHQIVYPDDEPYMPATNRQGLNVNQPRLSTLTPQPEPQSKFYNKNRRLQEIIYTILKGLVDEDYSFAMNATTDSSTMPSAIDNDELPSQQNSDSAKNRINLIKQKKELEAKDKQDKQQRDGYSTVVKNYDQFQKKTNRDAIDSVNKQLSQPTSPTLPIK